MDFSFTALVSQLLEKQSWFKMVLSREYSAATKQLLNDKGLKCVCELCDCGWVFSGNLYSSACLHADGQKYPNRKLKSKASCKLKDLLLLRSKIEMPRSKLKFRTRFFKYSLPGYGPCVNNTLCNTPTNFNKIPHECHKICITIRKNPLTDGWYLKSKS